MSSDESDVRIHHLLVCGLGHLYYWKFRRLRRARDVEMYDISTPPRFDEIRKY